MKKVLVYGSGGRDHCLADKYGNSQHVDKVFFAPGNPDQLKLFSNSEAIGCSLAPPEFIPYGDAGAGLASQKALYFGIKS